MKLRTLSCSLEKTPRALLTTVSSDSHSWNMIFMEIFMTEYGFEVTNLGPCSPTTLTVSQAQETAFDLIIISSINGHGVIEGPEIVKALRVGGVETPVVIGGKLNTGTTNDEVECLRNAGFDGVFPDSRSTLFEDFTEFLENLTSRDASLCGVCKKCDKATPFLGIAAE